MNIQSADFIAHGFADISKDVLLVKEQVQDLHFEIKKTRKFDKSLFIECPNNLASLNHKGVNPRPNSNNLLLGIDTSFIEENKFLREILEDIFGGEYNILLKK
jgi:hypothetical protein